MLLYTVEMINFSAVVPSTPTPLFVPQQREFYILLNVLYCCIVLIFQRNRRKLRGNFLYVIETTLMHYLSSVYFVTQPLHVSGIFVAHHQQVYCIYTTNWYPLIRSIGNYSLADLHRQYKKYIHKRPKHILLQLLTQQPKCFSFVLVFHCYIHKTLIRYILYHSPGEGQPRQIG